MRIEADWMGLSEQAARMIDLPLREIIAANPARTSELALRVGPIYGNFSRQRFDRVTLATLFAMARSAKLPQAIRAMFDGATVNPSEQRPALHTALRSRLGQGPVVEAAHAEVDAALQAMAGIVSGLRESRVTDVVNVGIGGSDLGPRLAVEALQDFSDGRFRIHFLNNADAGATHALMSRLDPAHTAVVLVSKSFGTQETLLNAELLRPWLNDDSHLFAVSANVAKAAAIGIPPERILPMWDWVGGRYSLWSAVGLVLALSVGMDNFHRLLSGAAQMDAHVLEQPPESNLAIWHALTTVWNRNGLGLDTHAVLPYDDRLALLPAYLQQLVMESLGKSVRQDGQPVAVATVPVIWGGPGTSSQHSFFQALHQGRDTVPADFIGVARPAHPHRASHDALLSHLLAQGEAMANGAENADPQKAYPGNRPSTFLLLDELTPESLGALVAMYEHSVYAQSVLWGINAFDQWGVELGKQIAGSLLPAVAAQGADAPVPADPVTAALLSEIRARR